MHAHVHVEGVGSWRGSGEHAGLWVVASASVVENVVEFDDLCDSKVCDICAVEPGCEADCSLRRRCMSLKRS